jgi:acyl-ACP thioesterase
VTARLVPRPGTGRIYETSRTVRISDADPTGRLRLDAIARFVHDVGNDDVADAGLDPNIPWVVRRSEVEVTAWPSLGERLAVATWCGGTGSRWAERRVSFESATGRIDVATLVIHLDRATGRPAKLPAWFDETYAEAAQGRTLTTRLVLPDPPEGAASRPWAVRWTDLDVMGHVNNAVVWAAIEEECHRRGVLPADAVVEWGGALEADDAVDLVADGTGIWLCVDGAARVAAEVTPAGGS